MSSSGSVMVTNTEPPTQKRKFDIYRYADGKLVRSETVDYANSEINNNNTNTALTDVQTHLQQNEAGTQTQVKIKDYYCSGISGLSNPGNTCYVNATLQCLIASPMFVAYMLKSEFSKTLCKNIIGTLTKNKKRKSNL